MKADIDNRVWIVAGALGALILAVVLMPLRTLTSASNLAFAFLAFTIIVAELGGRAPALITALLSAMSLNFFLTEPYLTLAISKREDLIAFLALTVCGLIAAAFGKRRRLWSEAAARTDQELSVLKKFTEELKQGTPLDRALHHLQSSFGLGTVALRDVKEHVLAAAPTNAAPAAPKTSLNPDTFLPLQETRHRFGTKGLRLPEGGGRVILPTSRGDFFLDIAESGSEGLGPDESRTLAIAVAILALELSHRK